MEIKVLKLDKKALEEKGVFNWPVWEKEVSRFPWHYDSNEDCYFLEGEVTVVFGEGKEVKVKEGDYVTFPEGLDCTWIVSKPVKKHYNFY